MMDTGAAMVSYFAVATMIDRFIGYCCCFASSVALTHYIRFAASVCVCVCVCVRARACVHARGV